MSEVTIRRWFEALTVTLIQGYSGGIGYLLYSSVTDQLYQPRN